MSSGRRTRGGTGVSRPPGMFRAPEHAVDDSTVDAVSGIFTRELRWMFTPALRREYGIDGHAEAVTSGGAVTGRTLAAQIKGGDSFFKPTRDGSGWRFWEDNDHLHYWLGYSRPVLVILYRPQDGAAFWQVVRPSTVSEHTKGFTLVVPSSQRLDASAAGRLLDIATNERGLLESFAGHCAVLPPSSARVLGRAQAADPLPAARLAEKLATGRDKPALAVSALCASPPSWLTATAAAQDLWLAAASYALLVLGGESVYRPGP